MLDGGVARAFEIFFFVSDQTCFYIILGFNVPPRVDYGLPFPCPLVG